MSNGGGLGIGKQLKAGSRTVPVTFGTRWRLCWHDGQAYNLYGAEFSDPKTAATECEIMNTVKKCNRVNCEMNRVYFVIEYRPVRIDHEKYLDDSES